MKHGWLWTCARLIAALGIFGSIAVTFRFWGVWVSISGVLIWLIVLWLIKSGIFKLLEIFKRIFEIKETELEKYPENRTLETFTPSKHHSDLLRAKITLKDKIKNLINDNQIVIRHYGVLRLGLFGSVIRGEEKENSDIDLIAEFKPGMKNYDNFINLCFFFEDMLGRKVDLLTPEGISPIIRKNIEREVEYVEIIS